MGRDIGLYQIDKEHFDAHVEPGTRQADNFMDNRSGKVKEIADFRNRYDILKKLEYTFGGESRQCYYCELSLETLKRLLESHIPADLRATIDSLLRTVDFSKTVIAFKWC